MNPTQHPAIQSLPKGWIGAIVPLLALAGCGSDPSAPKAAPAASARTVSDERQLLRLSLEPSSESRLGIAVERLAAADSSQTRALAGEIVVPAAGGGLPVSATTDLATLGANQARADGDVARVRAELMLAQQAAARAGALVQEEAGSVRARDEAQAALGVARANLNAAIAQRRLLGPAVGALGAQGVMWVRVAVFAGDVATIDRSAPAIVHLIGDTSASRRATPIAAPPSANPAAGTVDLYYAVANPGGTLRLGQRVSVDMPLARRVAGLSVSAAAIVRDIHGGEWVYVRTSARTYERRRVQVASVSGDRAILASGPTGSEIVIAGAAELFGLEFGAE